jgi:hypothetical protein
MTKRGVTMTMPGFTAEASLSVGRSYRGLGRVAEAPVGSVVPAIPYCGNCDYILDWCARLHSHAAICGACLTGDCYGPPTAPPPLGGGYYN